MKKERHSLPYGLTYSPMGEPLEKQLRYQGFTLGEKAKSMEEALYAIHTCVFYGLCTEAQQHSMYYRLDCKVKRYMKEVTE